MYPTGTRVIIIGGYFSTDPAKEKYAAQHSDPFVPTGTIVFSNPVEYRVQLDQPFWENPATIVTMLKTADVQVLTPKERTTENIF